MENPLRSRKLHRKIKKSIAPSREFAEKVKRDFLVFYDARYKSSETGTLFLNRNSSSWAGFVWKIGGGALVALGIIGGLSAYAYAKDVPPTSPLYSLKRFAENVSVALSSPAQKADLQLSFAAKRAQEINTIAAASSSAGAQALIKNLSDDFENEVSSSLAEISTEPSDTREDRHAGFSSLCMNLSQNATDTTSSFMTVAGEITRHAGLFSRVLSECGVGASSTIASGSSTPIFPPGHGIQHRESNSDDGGGEADESSTHGHEDSHSVGHGFRSDDSSF